MTARISVVALVLAVTASGCVVHQARNKDAAVRWIETPPEAIEEEGLMERRTEGYRALWLSNGGFAAVGLEWPRTGGRAKNADAGVETTIAFCPRSLDASPPSGDLPRVELPSGIFYGLNLGLSIAERQGGAVGPAYVEAQVALSLDLGAYLGTAAGWAADFDEGHHGPQVTAFLGPFYMRVTHLLRDSTNLLFGITLKLPLVFAWER